MQLSSRSTYSGLIAHDAEAASAALAAQLVTDLKDILVRREVARVVLSTGATPVRTYAHLLDRHRNALPWARVCVQQLDEYSGLAADDPRRFSTFLQRHVVAPLGTRFLSLTGEETDATLAQCDAHIAAVGGLDLVLYGVGVNGHLGFNEPGSAFTSPARRVRLHASTRERIKPVPGPAPEEAVTLGLCTLNAARCVRVIALGATKRAALARGLLEPPDPATPLSSLQTHANVRIFVDAEAAPEGLVLG